MISGEGEKGEERGASDSTRIFREVPVYSAEGLTDTEQALPNWVSHCSVILLNAIYFLFQCWLSISASYWYYSGIQ